MNNQKGFTLIELMIVVTIVGILTTTAYPSFQNYVYKAKIVESHVIFNAISTAQKTYLVQNGAFFNTDSYRDTSYAMKIGVPAVASGSKVSINEGANFGPLGNIVAPDAQLNFVFQSPSGGFDSNGDVISNGLFFSNDVDGGGARSPEDAIIYGSTDGDQFMVEDGKGCSGIPAVVDSLTPVNFGVEANPGREYHWNATAAVANFSAPGGSTCVTLFKIMTFDRGAFSETPVVNLGSVSPGASIGTGRGDDGKGDDGKGDDGKGDDGKGDDGKGDDGKGDDGGKDVGGDDRGGDDRGGDDRGNVLPGTR